MKGYKETRWSGMHKQSGTRAGTTKGTHAYETPAHQRRPTTPPKKQPPNEDAIHAPCSLNDVNIIVNYNVLLTDAVENSCPLTPIYHETG